MTPSLRKAQGLTTVHIPIGTLFLIEVIRAKLNIARACGSRNRCLLDRECEHIHEEEMRNDKR